MAWSDPVARADGTTIDSTIWANDIYNPVTFLGAMKTNGGNTQVRAITTPFHIHVGQIGTSTDANDRTITSTTFADINAAFSIACTTGLAALLYMRFNVTTGGAPTNAQIDLLVNGTSVSGGAGIWYDSRELALGARKDLWWLATGLTPGSNTFKFQALRTGGTNWIFSGSTTKATEIRIFA